MVIMFHPFCIVLGISLSLSVSHGGHHHQPFCLFEEICRNIYISNRNYTKTHRRHYYKALQGLHPWIFGERKEKPSTGCCC
uniref:Putative secreted protein n=1 Tax=Anopheles darlingi TaxID=43151 RepID=A0A2M4D383_ANODA